MCLFLVMCMYDRVDMRRDDGACLLMQGEGDRERRPTQTLAAWFCSSVSSLCAVCYIILVITSSAPELIKDGVVQMMMM